MKFPQLRIGKKAQTMSRQDEEVFLEASQLARLRLEQCIADLEILAPAIDDMGVRRGSEPVGRFPKLP